MMNVLNAADGRNTLVSPQAWLSLASLDDNRIAPGNRMIEGMLAELKAI